MNRLRSPWLLVAAALAAAPAAADWLVMKDGGRIETKGAWTVEGRRVLFTQPNGTLSVLRADDVDLDQSAAVTAAEAEAARKAALPEPPVTSSTRPPVLRLTEKDIPPSPEEGAPAEEKGASESTAAGGDLGIATWQKVQNASAESVEIFGSIKNSGENNITAPTILVMVYDEDGGLLATNEGTINSGMIGPGQTANFRVAFPGVPDFTSVKFDVQGRGFRSNPAASEEGAEGEAEPEYEEPIDEELPSDDGGA
ncbi:MAG: hypothetical protein AMXMBFR36_02650 [Acidobacteriota bacterium]